jgi:hypothetical protein
MLVLLISCVLPQSDSGGQSGTEEDSLPGYCQEVARTAVGLDELPAGFTDTPRQVIAAAVGTWAGVWESGSELDEPGDATVTLADAAAVAHVVEEEYVGAPEDEDAMGDAEVSCDTHYEIALSATFAAADAGLGEAFGVTLEADATGRRGFIAYLAVDDVSRTVARPTQWDWSELYTELVVESSIQDGILAGSVSWVTTGSAEPSTEHYALEQYALGEGLGEFTLARDDDALSNPGYCQEVSRASVALDELPAGFMLTPREVLATVAGDWGGAWDSPSELDTGGEASMSLVYEDVGVELVVDEYVPPGPDEVDDGSVVEPDATPDATCVPHYEIPLTGTFTSVDGGLDESFQFTLETGTAGDSAFAAHLPIAQVAGTSRPTQWDPSEESTELIIDATFGSGGLGGTVWWVSSGSAEPAPEPLGVDEYAIGESVGDFTLLAE